MLGTLAAASLLVLPGAWAAAALRSMERGSRCALAVALSPFVAALELLALRAAGVPFTGAVWTIALLNLPAGWFLLCSPPHESGGASRRSVLAGLGAFLVALVAVALPWLLDADFFRFSWHGLMHADICRQFLQGRILPEEPELAGVPLAYAWGSHAYLALLAWAAQQPPTALYPAVNALLLAASGVFLFQLVRRLGGSQSLAWWALPWLALGLNLPGTLGWSLIPINESGLAWALLGDVRTAPFLQKLSSFSAMPFGLALFAALVWLLALKLRGEEGSARRATWLLPLVQVALAGLYPLLGLIGLLLLGLAALERWLRGPVRPAVVFCWALAMVASLLLMNAYTLGRTGSALELSSGRAFAKKAVSLALSMGPFLALVWAGRERLFAKAALPFLLCLGALGAAAANACFRLGALSEYKLYFAAGLCVMPPALVAFEQRWPGWSSRSRPLTALAWIVVLAVMASYGARRVPTGGTEQLVTQHDSVWISLADDQEHAGWTRAVREKTPPDTVLVVDHPDFHASSVTARSLFVPTQKDRNHFGYHLNSRANMLQTRGYDEALFRRRIEALDDLYRSGDADRWRSAWRAVTALGRPVAVHHGPAASAHLAAWLDAIPGIARLPSTGEHHVWLWRPD